jgi:hypothetical protein
VKRPKDGPWSIYDDFALGNATMSACLIPIDDVRLPLWYQA